MPRKKCRVSSRPTRKIVKPSTASRTSSTAPVIAVSRSLPFGPAELAGTLSRLGLP